MITLRQIEVFRELMRTRTTIGAANALKVSQPAVSNIIRQMEDRIGFPLFERIGNRLVPTPDADEVIRDSEAIFKLYAAFNHRMEARKRSEIGNLRLAVTPPVANALIPGFLAEFLANRPSVGVSVDMRRVTGVLDAVEARMADIGLVLNPPARDGLAIAEIGHCRLVCCFAPGHPFERRTAISTEDVLDERMILYEVGSPLDNLLKGFLPEGMRHNATAEVRYSSLACQLAEAGIGIAIADTMTAVAGGRYNLKLCPLDPELTAPVCIVSRAGEPPKQLQTAFMKEILRSDFVAQMDRQIATFEA